MSLVQLIRDLVSPMPEVKTRHGLQIRAGTNPTGGSLFDLSWPAAWDLVATEVDRPGLPQDGTQHHQILRADVSGSRQVCDIIAWASRVGRASELYVLLFELKNGTGGGAMNQLENSVSLAELPLRRILLRGEWSELTEVRFLLVSLKGGGRVNHSGLPKPGVSNYLGLPYVAVGSRPYDVENFEKAAAAAEPGKVRPQPWVWPWLTSR